MEHDWTRPPRWIPPSVGRRHRTGRRARSVAVPLARLAVTALVTIAALGTLSTAARADGDPGSDVLVSQTLFLPVDAHASPLQRARLAALVRSADASGFAIRVAVIAQPDDLGAVAALWRKPAAYARFLGIELSLVYKQRLLVVMPNGFGFNWPGHSASAARQVLARVPAGTGAGLAGAAEAAVRGLAAASGVRLASQPVAVASHGSRGLAVPLAMVLTVLAVVLAVTFAVRRRRRGGAGGLSPARALTTPSPGRALTRLSPVRTGTGLSPGRAVTTPSPGRAVTTPSPGRTGTGPPRSRVLAARHPWRLVASGALALVVAGSAGTAYVLVRARNASTEQSLRPSGIPAGISTSLANEMAMDALSRRAAPLFTLSDQAGRRMSLSSFRGKVVVLDFMDDRCTNVCPVVSAEFIAAHRALGPRAGTVVFIGINANPFYRSVKDVAAFTSEQRLSVIPGWHYFTGTLPELRNVWRMYHITITARSRDGTPGPLAPVRLSQAVRCRPGRCRSGAAGRAARPRARSPRAG